MNCSKLSKIDRIEGLQNRKIKKRLSYKFLANIKISSYKLSFR